MFILQNYSSAVIFCVITMICWGSWANTQKFSSKEWRFELYYWDYGIGVLLSSLLLAFTLGSNGEAGRAFLDDISQADTPSLQSAFVGGVLFNLANILLVAAIGIAGMSVAFPVGIGLALVIGVATNFMDHPTGNVFIISSGVLMIVLAIILNAMAYRDVLGKSKGQKGLILSLIAGSLMGFFYKYVASSMAQNFTAPELGKLSPYTALFMFSTGLLLSNLLLNYLQMKFPFQGKNLSFSDYFSGSLKDHLMGILGGLIWFIGMAFSILASEKAGPALSYGLGQGATLVAALWGIYIWKEFKLANKVTKIKLNLMLILYAFGLAVLILSK
ncbi:MAG: sugar permease [Bacteroidota bacterium]|jgi:glucose uptake protein